MAGKEDANDALAGRMIDTGSKENTLKYLEMESRNPDRLRAATARFLLKMIPVVDAWMDDEIKRGIRADELMSAAISTFLSTLGTAATVACMGDVQKAQALLAHFEPLLIGNYRLAVVNFHPVDIKKTLEGEMN